MDSRTYSFAYRHYDSRASMPEDERTLAELAVKACDGAYAPYSGYRVGAAARLADGTVITASNQESEVFPAGLCAERGLIAIWQAHHVSAPIEVMAIAATSGDGECYPCGICRQAMVDTERRQRSPMRVVMCGPDSATVVESASDLVPFAFSIK